jgi:hypothetical protein
MAETWRICEDRGLAERLPELCLSAYAAVIDARGAVVRKNYEDFIREERLREVLGRARSRILPYDGGYVEYEVFIKTAAFAYLKWRNALVKMFGEPIHQVLKKLHINRGGL